MASMVSKIIRESVTTNVKPARTREMLARLTMGKASLIRMIEADVIYYLYALQPYFAKLILIVFLEYN